tara:strand:+ start:3041 stop:3526 length:486 start_codon:yes stop_codon:yes gene_type:complete
MKQVQRHLGFTLIELVLSLAILAMLAALAAPLFGNNESLQVDVTRRLLTSDLEYAQIIAISHPEDEIAVVIDSNGWHIANTNAPETPLLDSVTQEALVLELGEGAASSADNVVVMTNSENSMIIFDQNGGLIDFSQPVDITITSGETSTVVQVSPMTGSIQ